MHRLDPKFGFQIVPLHMHMNRLASFIRVKVQTIGAAGENDRHFHGFPASAAFFKFHVRGGLGTSHADPAAFW